MFKNVNIVLTLGLLVAPSLLAQGNPSPVVVSEAQETEMAQIMWVPGTVVSREDARIAGETTGRLDWVAEIGQQIQQGEVLARIDNRALLLQQERNKATIARLEANLVYLQKQTERQKRLIDLNNAARNDYDQAVAQTEMARQDLEQAKIVLKETQLRLEQTQITAPFTGRIVERLHQPGEFLGSGEDVVRLVNTKRIEVRAQAPVNLAHHLTDGQNVTVKDEFQEFINPIRTYIPVSDERSRMIEVRVGLERGQWIIGAPVRVGLPQGNMRQVVAVNRDALILRQDNTYLFKVLPDGTAGKVLVKTGLGSGTMIEVIGDLSPGEKVVIRGGERLREGQPVEVSQVN